MKLGTFFLLSVIIVIFLSGCAKQISVATSGVVIEKFTPQMSTVASNSPVEFTLLVKNIGEREATDVKAVLGGLTFLTPSIKEETEKYWRSEFRGIFTDFLKDLDANIKTTDNLLGEDISSGFKGEQGVINWHLAAPVQTRDQTYEATVNLIYGYSTISTILIKAVHFSYLQSLPESEQKSVETGVVASKTTKGPIEVSVKSDQAIISDFSTLPIEIEFKNVGGGRTFVGGGKEEDTAVLYSNIQKGINKIHVELPSDLKCNLNPISEGSTKKYEVRMIEGKSGRILCNKVIGAVSTIQTLSTDIKAEYRYLIEGKTAVKVSKTLYQSPIFDISLDATPTNIEHLHNEKTTAIIDLKITNVGNQDVDISSLRPSISTNGVLELDIPFTKTTLKPFDHALKSLQLGLAPSEKEIMLSSKVDKVDKEENIENNKFDKTIPLDYDISVEKIEETVKEDFSFDLVAHIKNNGKTVAGKRVPINFVAKKANLDICNLVKEITTIEKTVTEKVEFPCKNENKDLTLDITVLVPASDLESDTTNNIKIKSFEINYDVAILDSSAKFVRQETDGRFAFQLTTTIKNVGNVIVKGSDLTITFKDDGTILQTACPAVEKDLKSQESVPITCEYKTTEAKTLAKAKVTSKLPEKDTSNNIGAQFEISHEVLPVFRFNLRIVPGSSKSDFVGAPTAPIGLLTDKGKYTLSTTVENTGETEVNGIVVNFAGPVDGVRRDFCSTTITKLVPKESTTASCETKDFLPGEVPDAEAAIIVTDDNLADNKEKFTIFADYDLGVTYLTWDEISRTDTDITYTFTATVKNLGTEATIISVVTFKDDAGQTICDNEPTTTIPDTVPISFTTSPGSEQLVKCNNVAPKDKIVKVTAVVTTPPIEPSAKRANNQKTVSTSQTQDIVIRSITLSSTSPFTFKIPAEVQNLGPKMTAFTPKAEVLSFKNKNIDISCTGVNNFQKGETRTAECTFTNVQLEDDHYVIRLTLGDLATDIDPSNNEKLIGIKCKFTFATSKSCELTEELNTLTIAKVGVQISAFGTVSNVFNNKDVTLKQISPTQKDTATVKCENNICRFELFTAPTTSGTYVYAIFSEGKELVRETLTIE